MLAGPLLPKLFLRGLGELLMLHLSGDRVLLGNIMVEKGKVVFKDRKFLSNVTPAQANACIDYGILGAICDLQGREWETMTFLGRQHCDISINLSETRSDLLKAARSKGGDTLIDFEGSWYRGFHLMLEYHFLPVVSMLPMPTTRSATGLAVCDLKMATVPLAELQKVHATLRMTVDKYVTFAVEDVDVDEEEFDKLFSGFIKRE
jgi:hypothetical protein